MPADVQSSDEKFEQPGGSGSEERRMGKERRARGFIGEVLMAITREKSMGYYSGDRFQKRREREEIAGGRRGRSDGRGPHVGEGEEGSGVPVRV
jgi:hypothetical protein